jgi:hypothetical protein
MRRLRDAGAVLMIIYAFTHISQIWVYGLAGSVIWAALFGVSYLIIGILLLGRSRIGLWLGAILPAIGGLLGIRRFLMIHANPFSIFHVCIDVLVISICVYCLQRRSAG